MPDPQSIRTDTGNRELNEVRRGVLRLAVDLVRSKGAGPQAELLPTAIHQRPRPQSPTIAHHQATDPFRTVKSAGRKQEKIEGV